MQASAALVEMVGIRKAFGPVEVLRGVDFDVRPGEVHVLAGGNGAGKSTLIRILSGVLPQDQGTLRLAGVERHFRGPAEARAAGVATIHQELSLVAGMSVADNLFLGRELGRPFVDFAAQRRHAREVLATLGLDLDVDRPVGELPISIRQLVEIARALSQEARVLVMDEPTSALDEPEANALFDRIAELKARGNGVVYVTHKMDEVYRIADRITVLRDGELVGTATPSELPRDELVRWLVGRELRPEAAARASPDPEEVLRVEGLAVERAVHGVSLRVGRGEIVGLAGFLGSGASEVLAALFGVAPGRVTGRVHLGGEPYSLATSPREALARGVMLLPKDRKTSGLALGLSVLANATLASLSRFTTAGFVRRAAEREAVEGLVRTLGLVTPSIDEPVSSLSGGNQQKVVLGRAALQRPRVLLADEPTRGVDVGAKADIYALLRGWADEGTAMLVLTSELDELLLLCDRIIVLHAGRVTAELGRDEATRQAIVAAAMGAR